MFQRGETTEKHPSGHCEESINYVVTIVTGLRGKKLLWGKDKTTNKIKRKGSNLVKTQILE